MNNKGLLTIAMGSLMLSSVAFAGSAPSIGGGASIKVNIGEAGILNAGAGANGAKIKAKQSIASVLSGSIAGKLDDTVTIGKAGIVNVGAGADGAQIDTCQSIGSVGDNCSESATGL